MSVYLSHIRIRNRCVNMRTVVLIGNKLLRMRTTVRICNTWQSNYVTCRQFSVKLSYDMYEPVTYVTPVHFMNVRSLYRERSL